MREDVFIPEHRTNILPFRWLANYIFHPISMLFFNIGLRANQQLEYDYAGSNLLDEIKEKVGFKTYKFLNYPYDWWGTVYKLNFKNLDIDFDQGSWDDYDENGIPYWDYFWHNDPETGDGWRLVNKYQDERDGSIIPEIQKELDSGKTN